MEQSESNAAKKLKEALAASVLTISLYLLINLVLLGLLNIKGLWNVFIYTSTGSVTSQDISPLTDAFNSFQSRLNTPFVFLFWILIGCVSYSVVWGLQSAIAVSRKQAREAQYLRNGGPMPKSYWHSTMTTNLLLLTSALSTVTYMILYFRLLLPSFARLFHNGLYNPSHYLGVADVFGAVVASTIAIYVFVLLCRVVRYHWHTIRPI
jgi:hypothetical protein